MILLLSGATALKAEQRDINKSLGGLMSSTRVPNGKLNSIFPNISTYNLKNKDVMTLALFIYNDSNETINNLSIESFYQKRLNEFINYTDFEFSISQPTETGAIELIGNISEEPFYSDWFTCDSEKSECIIKIHRPGNFGDEILIFGESGYLTDNSVESFQNDLVSTINQNRSFKAEPKGKDEVYIKYDELEGIQMNSNFVTNGLAELKGDVDFSDYKDGKVLIYDSLEPGKAIGIWIKRSCNENYKSNSNDICKLSNEDNIVELEQEENFNILFHYD